MTNSSLRQVVKFIFLPALLLSLFLSGSSLLFRLAQNALLTKQLGLVPIPALKFATGPFQLIFALSILAFSIYQPFEKVFRRTLLSLAGIILVLTVAVGFQEHLQLNRVSGAFGTYQPLVTFWPTSLMYIVLSLVDFSFYSLFIWGFINRVISLHEGNKYYIPLAFVLGSVGTVISNIGSTEIGAAKWSLLAINIPAISLMVGAWVVFNWSWNRLPDSLVFPKPELSISNKRFPFLSGAYVLAGALMVKSFLDIIFKLQIKAQFPDPVSYSKGISYFTASVGYSTLAISMIWVVLGTWLILKKGWKTTALSASISIFVGGMIFLSVTSLWLNQGIFTGLLISATSVLFFPLIQMLYLYKPYHDRFKTKIMTEMVALPLMKAIPPLTIQGLVVMFGSMPPIIPYLKIFVIGLMGLLVFVSQRLGSRFLDKKLIVINPNEG